MARKTKEEAEKTYHELLSSAATLFTRQGVAATKLDDIAKHANLTRGALYWHFRGKDEILRALLETYAIPRMEPFEQKFLKLSQTDPVHNLLEIMQDMSRMIFEDKKVGQAIRLAIHNIEVTDEDSELQQFLAAEIDKFRNAVNHAFEVVSDNVGLKEEFTPQLAAQGFICLFHGMMDQHFRPRQTIDMKQGSSALINAYLVGVLKD